MFHLLFIYVSFIFHLRFIYFSFIYAHAFFAYFIYCPIFVFILQLYSIPLYFIISNNNPLTFKIFKSSLFTHVISSPLNLSLLSDSFKTFPIAERRCHHVRIVCETQIDSRVFNLEGLSSQALTQQRDHHHDNHHHVNDVCCHHDADAAAIHASVN